MFSFWKSLNEILTPDQQCFMTSFIIGKFPKKKQKIMIELRNLLDISPYRLSEILSYISSRKTPKTHKYEVGNRSHEVNH